MPEETTTHILPARVRRQGVSEMNPAALLKSMRGFLQVSRSSTMRSTPSERNMMPAVLHQVGRMLFCPTSGYGLCHFQYMRALYILKRPKLSTESCAIMGLWRSQVAHRTFNPVVVGSNPIRPVLHRIQIYLILGQIRYSLGKSRSMPCLLLA